MAGKFFPTVDHPAVQENMYLFNIQPTATKLCTLQLYGKYRCENCPFGTSTTNCALYYRNNPHLPLFVIQLRLAHPELFI